LKRLLGGYDGELISLPRCHFSQPAADLPTGKKVEVSFSAELLIGLSSIVYLVPVLVMLLFAVAVVLALPESEFLVMLASALGLGSGLLGAVALVRSAEVYTKRSLICDICCTDTEQPLTGQLHTEQPEPVPISNYSTLLESRNSLK